MRSIWKRLGSIVICSVLLVSFCQLTEGLWLFAAQTGVVTLSEGYLNVRSGAGTNYAAVGQLEKGDVVTVTETVQNGNTTWYKVQKGSLSGYVSAAYILLQVEYKPDADFEAYLTKQNFPESYKNGLRKLHTQYPNWVFVAQHVVPDWNTALAQEARVGRNLVLTSARNSWKSMEQGAYNWNTKSYVVFDSGGWIAAQKEVVAYYMDPRNFLDDTSIFQFECLSYSTAHTADGVRQILDGSFMTPLVNAFMETARTTGVSAFHLASRALQEQGKTGNALGTGYAIDGKKYYNIFDIGAYQTATASAIQNGAVYAKARGWDTPEKSITGGAEQIGRGYIKMGQDTLYLQKFDVVDGGNGYYGHQYMTNVTAAKAESSSMKRAYSAETLKSALVFNIPVYRNMPQTACAAPQSNGNNDNTLTALSVAGYSLTPTFSRYTTEYALTVPATVTAVTLEATKSDSGARVSGTGKIVLSGADTAAKVVVTAPSGLTRTYTVHIFRDGITDNGPHFGDTKYTVGTVVSGIAPGATAKTLIAGLPVKDGTVRLVTARGAAVTDKVATGQLVQLMDGNTVVASYPVVIYGDTSGDGAVTSRDLLISQKHILGLSTLSGAYLTAADSGKDGKLTSADLLRTQKQILGLSSAVL